MLMANRFSFYEVFERKRSIPLEGRDETKIIQGNGKTVKITGPKKLNREPDYVSFEKQPKSKTSSGIKWTTFALYADPSEYDKIREEWNYLLSETSPMITVK